MLSLCAGKGVLSTSWCQASFPRFLLALLMPLHLGPPLMEYQDPPSSTPSSTPSATSSPTPSSPLAGPPPHPHSTAHFSTGTSNNSNVNGSRSHYSGTASTSLSNSTMQQECARLLLQSTAKGVLYYFVQGLFMRPGIPQIGADAAFLLGLFLFITVIMETLSILVLLTTGIRIKPHFNRPFIATSFRSFWAHRWNLTVSNCFRQAVYEPALEALLGLETPVGPTQGQPGFTSGTKSLTDGQVANGGSPEALDEQQREKRVHKRGLSFQTSRLLAMTLTFFVSGVLHEVAVWYLASTVTGEMMAFFMLQPSLIVAELALKRAGLAESVPAWIACPFVVGTLFLLAHCLFLPPFARLGTTDRVVAQLHSWFER